MTQLGVILPALVGMLASLLGVLLGSLLTRRAHNQHWSRDRQIDACLMIMRESNRAQFALNRLWQGKGNPDWIPWNEALVTLTLVGEPDIVRAALAVDETFWVTNRRIETGELRSAEAWAQAREAIEAARLNFINMTRWRIVGGAQALSQFVARPPLPPPPAASDQGTSEETQATMREHRTEKQPETTAGDER
ncbi:hypothetical protein [Streptosporangium sp. NPDC049046]|uniref:hypothetical protein n=1 Tax=Streptosporangium sp. NPDC049046 TaxID=3155031 RepID=UPI0034192641